MQILKNRIAIRLISLVLLPLMLLYPAVGLAAETTPSSSTTATKSDSTKKRKTGPQKPTGADANTYKYNEATDLWENDHYTWDPATGQTAPKQSPDYSYNPDTGKWDTTSWKYDAPSGKYVPNVTSTSQPPAKAAQDNSQKSTTDSNYNKVTANSESDSAYNLFYNAKISNTVNSTTTTGNAAVAQNTVAGSALSGDAQTMANIINVLQSSWGSDGSQPTTFINNVDGDVYGDLVIDPGQMPGNIATGQSQNANLDMNVQNSGQINNQINLAANSGNATVNKNTQAGDATTGTAQAIANVVNMINSTIASGKSFVGMININGNFNGDILMPADMINQLLASNSVPKTTINMANTENGALLANFNNNASITNQVNTSASSGSATVANNTTAGNATTGSASTNITVLNLTGQQVIGKDALLVFVNVQGKWLGMIVNAPGSTSALLGSGITSNSTNPNVDTTINGSSDLQISNNIHATAKSGDAAVTNNTLGGNAASGDASASVNIANFLNSSFSLSNWFGVLFINITGDWTGSFGINTAAGNPTKNDSLRSKSSSSVQVFRFNASSAGQSKISPVNTSYNNYNSGESHNDNGTVLEASVNKAATQPATNTAVTSSNRKGLNGWMIPLLSLIGAGTFLGTERRENRRKKATKKTHRVIRISAL